MVLQYGGISLQATRAHFQSKGALITAATSSWGSQMHNCAFPTTPHYIPEAWSSLEQPWALWGCARNGSTEPGNLPRASHLTSAAISTQHKASASLKIQSSAYGCAGTIGESEGSSGGNGNNITTHIHTQACKVGTLERIRETCLVQKMRDLSCSLKDKDFDSDQCGSIHTTGGVAGREQPCTTDVLQCTDVQGHQESQNSLDSVTSPTITQGNVSKKPTLHKIGPQRHITSKAQSKWLAQSTHTSASGVHLCNYPCTTAHHMVEPPFLLAQM